MVGNFLRSYRGQGRVKIGRMEGDARIRARALKERGTASSQREYQRSFAVGPSSRSASRVSTPTKSEQQITGPETVPPTHGVVGGRLGVEDERDDEAVETQHLGENEDEDLRGVSADDDDSVDPHPTRAIRLGTGQRRCQLRDHPDETFAWAITLTSANVSSRSPSQMARLARGDVS
jgi:hypothetical protein